MPGKMAGSDPRPAFGLPEVLVAVSTPRLSCKRAGKTRTLMPVWDSSGESRLQPRAISGFAQAMGLPPMPIPDDVVDSLISHLSGPLSPPDRHAFRSAAMDALARVPCWGEGAVYRKMIADTFPFRIV